MLGSPGRPLDESLRREMEPRLGADFSTVRIHSDPAAERSATAVDADAYTSGEHIVAGPGALDRRTIAHELTHVLQQRSGPVAGTDHGGGLRVSDPSDRFEREADTNARRVMAGPATTRLQWRPSAGGGRAPMMSLSGEHIVQRAKGKPKKDKKPRRRHVSAAGVKRRIAALKLVNGGFKGAGKWTKKVTARGSRSFRNLPDRQILRHTSTQFFWYAKKRLDKEEQEFQAMYVNERIVVASNLNSSASGIAAKLKSEFNSHIKDPTSENPLRSMLSQIYKKGDLRGRGVAGKFSKMNDPKGSRKPRDGAELMIHGLQQRVQDNPIMEADESSIGGLINAKDAAGKIIFLKMEGKYHAEQKLVLALRRSGFDGKAHVYGKKRPCAACSATLAYAVARGGMDIDFNHHAGGYWATAIQGLVDLAKDLGEDADGLEKWINEWGAELNREGMNVAIRMKKGVDRHAMMDGDEGSRDASYDSASDSEA
ncbi:DUF4157 domain-containing protein [Streptomyces sp. NRRL WC-3618]|uniref:eCIS core domain-containing protein n=1 Tax=Streptomyces sp. NRRL WC-3618 TaxID=1519490 RepID=UPI003B63A334